jgi:hypothetical protein
MMPLSEVERVSERAGGHQRAQPKSPTTKTTSIYKNEEKYTFEHIKIHNVTCFPYFDIIYMSLDSSISGVTGARLHTRALRS